MFGMTGGQTLLMGILLVPGLTLFVSSLIYCSKKRCPMCGKKVHRSQLTKTKTSGDAICADCHVDLEHMIAEANSQGIVFADTCCARCGFPVPPEQVNEDHLCHECEQELIDGVMEDLNPVVESKPVDPARYFAEKYWELGEQEQFWEIWEQARLEYRKEYPDRRCGNCGHSSEGLCYSHDVREITPDWCCCLWIPDVKGNAHPACYISNGEPYSLCVGRQTDRCRQCCIAENMEDEGGYSRYDS